MPNNLGEVIRKARIEKGLLQQELAEVSGVTRCQIINIESGKTKQPHFSTLRLLAQALDLDAEELFKIATCRKNERQNSIKEVIKEARNAKGLSQEELAEASGITRCQIINIESGKTKQSCLSTLRLLAQALELDAKICAIWKEEGSKTHVYSKEDK